MSLWFSSYRLDPLGLAEPLANIEYDGPEPELTRHLLERFWRLEHLGEQYWRRRAAIITVEKVDESTWYILHDGKRVHLYIREHPGDYEWQHLP